MYDFSHTVNLSIRLRQYILSIEGLNMVEGEGMEHLPQGQHLSLLQSSKTRQVVEHKSPRVSLGHGK
jgi:hypothetical protein